MRDGPHLRGVVEDAEGPLNAGKVWPRRALDGLAEAGGGGQAPDVLAARHMLPVGMCCEGSFCAVAGSQDAQSENNRKMKSENEVGI